MGIIAQIMLLSQGAATVPPAVLVRPPDLPVIEDRRQLTIIDEDRTLSLIADKREITKNA